MHCMIDNHDNYGLFQKRNGRCELMCQAKVEILRTLTLRINSAIPASFDGAFTRASVTVLIVAVVAHF
jgi:hypothetical protein